MIGQPAVTAILVVDVQRDFCPGGALAVSGGDRVVPVLNQILLAAHSRRIAIYATRDWHPSDSSHFLAGGGPWPVHCVAGSPGACFHADLGLPEGALIVNKGTTPNSDGYSAFEGCLADGTPLADHLSHRGITHLVIGGLATDYCIRHSVLDAIRGGWRVTLVTDVIEAVELTPGDGKRALAEMRSAGANLIRSTELDFQSLDWNGPNPRSLGEGG